MFKNLRTSTKLLLLCGLFVGSIVLATYSLIREQQIAINFVRQELLGTQYLGKLRAVYAAILTDESSANAGRSLSADSALDSLAAAESQTAGSFDTAKLEQDVAAAVRKFLIIPIPLFLLPARFCITVAGTTGGHSLKTRGIPR